LRVGFAGEEGFLVVFFAGHVEQVLRVAQVVIERREFADRVVEQLFFPAEGLGVLRVVPDVRVFEFPVDFD
jgi:hypothetical protein